MTWNLKEVLFEGFCELAFGTSPIPENPLTFLRLHPWASFPCRALSHPTDFLTFSDSAEAFGELQNPSSFPRNLWVRNHKGNSYDILVNLHPIINRNPPIHLGRLYPFGAAPSPFAWKKSPWRQPPAWPLPGFLEGAEDSGVPPFWWKMKISISSWPKKSWYPFIILTYTTMYWC